MREKYKQTYKEVAWKRWRNEYLTSLRKKHNLKRNKGDPELKVGEVVVRKRR